MSCATHSVPQAAPYQLLAQNIRHSNVRMVGRDVRDPVKVAVWLVKLDSSAGDKVSMFAPPASTACITT